MSAPLADQLARARGVVASLPPEKWGHIEKGRIFLADGDMIASVREQIPDGVDPDGDDPEAWDIGDAAVEEAGRRAEAVALLVNARAALLDVAEAAEHDRRARFYYDHEAKHGDYDTEKRGWDRRTEAARALDAALARLSEVLP